MTMRPIQSFDASRKVTLSLCPAQDCQGLESKASARRRKKMSFFHLFLQRIECLSYIERVTPLLICFPRRKSLLLNQNQEEIMNFIIWIVVGGILGWLASMVMRTMRSKACS